MAVPPEGSLRAAMKALPISIVRLDMSTLPVVGSLMGSSPFLGFDCRFFPGVEVRPGWSSRYTEAAHDYKPIT